MRRYNVPRLAFINKLDRAGADPWRVSSGPVNSRTLKLTSFLMHDSALHLCM